MDSKTADSETKAYVLLRELLIYGIFLTILLVCKCYLHLLCAHVCVCVCVCVCACMCVSVCERVCVAC